MELLLAAVYLAESVDPVQSMYVFISVICFPFSFDFFFFFGVREKKTVQRRLSGELGSTLFSHGGFGGLNPARGAAVEVGT